MEVSKETLAQLGHEGIKKVEGLAEFNKDKWKQVAENLKCPGGQMKNPDKEKREEQPFHNSSDPVSVWSEDTEETPRGIGADKILHNGWPPFDSCKHCIQNRDP
eukprot:11309460-Ditylum_brightwellii.AAC.1